ncbi:hypothetical protein AVU39_gp51 [Sulfolobus monocaudavirus SMV2]|uniref:hypothetical protein n=1 Tax=Sulfolobus monocaudavirus SMV2 TaxID=1580591 RepID=UPI0006D2EDA6|nr:hypothetical protein AVU39_gp51 [Sulfolobus monocaudavirus SMV2]AIZ11385.1 hypothetical protein [Sulfolobus monocaudavirus SMV2]
MVTVGNFPKGNEKVTALFSETIGGEGRGGMNELEIQEIFRELEEDVSRLSSMVRSLRSDIALKNNWQAKKVLETLSFLNQKIGANLFRIYSVVEKEPTGDHK